MQNIKSKVPYPCEGCRRDGKQRCMGVDCPRWQEWYKGGVWKAVTANAKAYLERRNRD